ncbi:MAG TPA: hypothetical protein VHW05_00020 [Phenylobacterium sp.]|jgi:hypothetical protein|nr:hypothetical protein [Phenylobacterium sp.]
MTDKIETAEDIGFMVNATARAIQDTAFETVTGEAAWQLAGRILCPIFDYAKPQSYIDGMKAARQEFAGIADDADLQEDFQGALAALVGAGALASLEAAVSADAWAILQAHIRVVR